MATLPKLTPLAVQPGEREAMINKYVKAGYSPQEATARVTELWSGRPEAPTGTPKPASMTFAPTGESLPTTAPGSQNAPSAPQSPPGGAQTPPAVNSPTPTPTAPTGASTGSNSAFQLAFSTLMGQGKKMEDLQNQKNKLVQQLYDRPLTPEELRTLSPQQQEAIRNGDKDLLEFQILTLNDTIKGRADENTSALTYLMDGYKTDQEELAKKAEKAYSSFSAMLEKYPQLYSLMSPESIQKVQQGDLPTPQDMVKLGTEYSKLAKTGANAGLIEVSPGATLYDPVTGKATFTAPEKKVPESQTGLDYKTQTQVDSLAKGFDASQIVKDYNVVQEKKLTFDQLMNSSQSGPGDMAMVYEFMKALDPNSVVRETEYASASKTGNIFTGTLAQFNGLFKPQGGFLSPQVKASFKKVVDQKLAVKEKQYDNLYNETARKINMKTGSEDGSDYLTNYKQAGVTTEKTPYELLKEEFPNLGQEEIDYIAEKRGIPKASGGSGSTSAASQDVKRVAAAIGQFESGGNYKALGPVTKNGDRAYGKYQVMGNNIPSWTKEALGKSMTKEQFLADPKAQDRVAEYKMGQHLAKYGNVGDVASVWFSGQPIKKAGNKKDIIGTSVPQYVKNVQAIYDKLV